ncbi:MAG: molybdopterin molybdotransferase MoeA [Deltaproteobacteria bacterium]|nr:molybdopterin molybdotransferase MoeA [Deltaproteobacteria bacterium]
MTTFDEAKDLILSRVSPLGRERVSISAAAGRVLAEEIRAPWDMPYWDNSAMDGYAVRSVDCAVPSTLTITGYQAAGDAVSPRVSPGCAVKIMTGSPIPEGCDAVVPFEETEESGGFVKVLSLAKPRAHIRFRGEDVRAGDLVIPAGTVLRPPEISMLASFGRAFVSACRRARVAVLSTGDELVELGEPLSPGKIINSNTHSLAAAVEEAGAVPVLLGIAPDDKEALREKIEEGLKADILVTSAGVSAGDRDFVREVMSELSVKEVFWKVGVKPGSPTAFGTKDGKLVFSLPGNPVSSLVTFEVFVRPALLKMMGHPDPLKRLVKATLKEPVRKKAGRVHFFRVRVCVEDGEYAALTSGDQNTGILRTMVQANGIAVLPADRTVFESGEKVDVYLLYQSTSP